MALMLLVDNYDSFTYNLAHLFGELGAEVVVRRNDEITVAEAEALGPSHVVISPGPGRPEGAGVSEAIVRAFAGRPVLGVCLGHQAIVRRVRRRGRRRAHARAREGDDGRHDGSGIFAGLPEDFAAGRYHSLAATSIPDVLEVSATARRRRGDGGPPPRAAGRRRAVPSRVGAHAARAASCARTSWRRD